MLGVLVACVLIAAICGCGSAKGPALAKVRGLVTLDGLPLTKGSVEFTPDSSQGTVQPESEVHRNQRPRP